MAKKTQNSAETRSSVGKLTFSLGFFTQSQNPSSDVNSQISYTSSKNGLEMMEDLMQQESDLFILAYNQNSIKSNQISKAIHLIPSSFKSGTYFVASNFAKSKFWKDMILGINATHDLSNFIIADKEALTRILDQAYVPQNEKEVIYLAEKSCCKECILQIENQNAPKENLLD